MRALNLLYRKMNLQTVIFVIVACQVSDSSKCPFGVEMCKLLCKQFEDCTVFGYSRVHLLCILNDAKASEDVLLFNTSKKHLPACPKPSRVFPDRNGHSICFQQNIPRKKKILAIQLNYEEVTEAFFIGPESGLQSSFKQINIPMVRNIAYLSSIQKLVLIRKTHPTFQLELRSLNFNSSDSLTNGNIEPTSVTVDDNQKLVFFASLASSHTAVRSINALTRKESEVIKVRKGVNTVKIALDAPRYRVIVCLKGHITSVSYDGSGKRSSQFRMIVDAMVVSKNGKSLYLCNVSDLNLLKVSLSGKLEAKIVNFNREVSKLIIFDGNVIMVSAVTAELYKVSLKQNKVELLTKLSGRHKYSELGICLIDE